jgi:hypothetical protein
MRRWLLASWRLSLGSVLLASACGGGDDDGGASAPNDGLAPAQVCGSLAADQCDRIYTGCSATEPQLRSLGLPNTKIECTAMLMDRLGCTSASSTKICNGAETFDAGKAASCSAQVKSADCSKVTASSMVSSYAAACGQCGLRP